MILHLYDADLRDREGRESQLRLADLDGFDDRRPTSSRNDLLEALEREVDSPTPVHSICLIDFRADSSDLDQSGFRIVDTIRRHRSLWRTTRLLLWLDYVTEENVREAAAVQADAVVDDRHVDREDGRPLQDILEEARRWKPRAHQQQSYRPTVFPVEFSRQDPSWEAGLDQRFESFFGFKPHPIHFTLLWGMADGIELRFLYTYCSEQGWVKDAAAAQRAGDKLTGAMQKDRAWLDSAASAHVDIAREFLSFAVPAQPSPLWELNWPSIGGLRLHLEDREIVRLAFLEDGAETALRSFLDHVSPELDKGRPRTAERFAAIDEAVGHASEHFGWSTGVTRGKLLRAAHALTDAFRDRRRSLLSLRLS